MTEQQTISIAQQQIKNLDCEISDDRLPDPANWQSAHMQKHQSWLVELSRQQITELRVAAEKSDSMGLRLVNLTSSHFELPKLKPTLHSISKHVIHGRGFVLIRGLPVQEVSRSIAARMYIGLGLGIGVPVSQNANGHILGHVKDLGDDPNDPKTRIYTTRFRQRFHVDSCDVVGLLCLQPAKSGGASAIASSVAIYNEILQKRPDLAVTLQRPFIYDRKGEVPQGEGPWYPMPVAHHHDNLISIYFARDFIESAQKRFPDIPRLSEIQIEALDKIEELAASDKFRLDMDFKPGDVQFIHNHQILHSRTGYEDFPEAERKRHLYRLWLATPNGRPLPKAYERRFGAIVAGKIRGGIYLDDTKLSAPLDVA